MQANWKCNSGNHQHRQVFLQAGAHCLYAKWTTFFND